MEVEFVKMWASPSTLHITVVVWGRDKAWMRFHELHVPLDDITEALVPMLAVELARRDGLDQPLPGMD